jgi:hypothetical protein
MDRIAALLHNGVTPYVVFDGGPLPMKKGTEEERRKARQKNRELGVQHYRNKRFGEARKCFVRAADVSPYMAHRVIQVRCWRLRFGHKLLTVALPASAFEGAERPLRGGPVRGRRPAGVSGEERPRGRCDH